MARSRYGSGRHRQSWQVIECPACGDQCEARPTTPGKPWHVRTHIRYEAGAIALCSGDVAKAS